MTWVGVREAPAFAGRGRWEVVSEDLRDGRGELLAIRDTREEAEEAALLFRLARRVAGRNRPAPES